MVSQSCLDLNLMAKDIEHFLMCLSAILDSSIEKCLFSSVTHFLIGLFGVLETSLWSSLYILEISPLSDMGLVNIFSHLVGSCFILLTVSFPKNTRSLFPKHQSIQLKSGVLN